MFEGGFEKKFMIKLQVCIFWQIPLTFINNIKINVVNNLKNYVCYEIIL